MIVNPDEAGYFEEEEAKIVIADVENRWADGEEVMIASTDVAGV